MNPQEINKLNEINVQLKLMEVMKGKSQQDIVDRDRQVYIDRILEWFTIYGLYSFIATTS